MTPDTTNRWLRVGLALVCLCSLVAAGAATPALAQQANNSTDGSGGASTPTNGTNTTAGTNATNATNATNGTDDSAPVVNGGVGVGESTNASGGGIFNFDFAAMVWDPLVSLAADAMAESARDFLGAVIQAFETPPPQDYDLVVQYGILPALALVLIFAFLECGLMPFKMMLTSYNGQRAIAMLFVGAIAVTSSWHLQVELHAFANDLTMWAIPSPEELTSSTDSMLKVAAGSAFSAIVFGIAGLVATVVVAGWYAARWVILHDVIGVFLPWLFAFAFVAPHKQLRSVGSRLLWQWVGLLVQMFPVGILFRIAHRQEWSFGFSGVMGAITTVVLVALAVVIPIIIQIAFFYAPPMRSVAGSAIGSAAGVKAAMGNRSLPSPSMPSIGKTPSATASGTSASTTEGRRALMSGKKTPELVGRDPSQLDGQDRSPLPQGAERGGPAPEPPALEGDSPGPREETTASAELIRQETQQSMSSTDRRRELVMEDARQSATDASYTEKGGNT